MTELREGGITLLPLGSLPGPLVAALPPTATAVPLLLRFLDPDGSLRADRLLAELPAGRGGLAPVEASPAHPTILITTRPLSTRECLRVLGLSCCHRGLAVVSAFGLDRAEAGSPEAGGAAAEAATGWNAIGEGAPEPVEVRRAARRLRNLVLHELGHLRGLVHCRNPGCLMAPVRDPEELDVRRDDSCEACGARLAASKVSPLERWGRAIRARLRGAKVCALNRWVRAVRGPLRWKDAGVCP